MITGFGNNTVSALASDITATQTTFSILPGTGEKFAQLLTTDMANPNSPHQIYAKLTLTDTQGTVFEICHLTNVSGEVLTVVRGQEGSVAKGWSLNDVVANFATRGSEECFVQIEQLQAGDYTSATAGGTPNGLTVSLPTTFFNNASNDWLLKTPLMITPIAANSGPATIQVTLAGKVIGTFPAYKGNRAELEAGDLLAGIPFLCVMDNTKTFFTVINPVRIYSKLGTAAFSDVQTSRDDTTPGRVLINGGALAVHSFTATSGAGGTVTDANNLPSNSVNFVYSSAANSPGFESSILDFSGLGGVYNVQFSASYAQPGMFKLRTKNGDNGVWNRWDTVYTTGNKPTASDVGAVPISGGNVGYLNNAEHFGIKSGVWEGAGAFASQYANNAAPFIVPAGFLAPRDVSQYQPIIKGIIQTKDYGFAAAISLGAYTTGANNFPVIVIHANTDGGTSFIWSFDPKDGAFESPGPINSVKDVSGSYVASRGDIRAEGRISSGDSIISGAGLFESGGAVRVYSQNNPPPQQDLSQYSTYDWVRQNFVTGMRQGSIVWSDRIFIVPVVPAGGAWVGANNNGSSDVSQMLPAYCPLQICINGNWFTISRM